MNIFSASVFASDVILFDHFDDGFLDPAWEITPQDVDGWTYDEAGTELTVTDIDPSIINSGNGGPSAIVKLRQVFNPVDDFDVSFNFSWDSDNSNTAMQRIEVYLLDSNDRIVAAGGYRDCWVLRRGSQYASIESGYWLSGNNTLPHADSALLTVNRNGVAVGTWTIEFAVDAIDNIYQGTYTDQIEVTVTP